MEWDSKTLTHRSFHFADFSRPFANGCIAISHELVDKINIIFTSLNRSPLPWMTAAVDIFELWICDVRIDLRCRQVTVPK